MDPRLSANVAGLAGAAVMMGFNMASRKLGLTSSEPLPEQVVESAIDSTGGNAQTGETKEEALEMGATVAFGMSSALLYSRVRNYLNIPGPLAGALFGLGVWALNIAGVGSWIGLREAPWKQEETRAITTIATYVLFGAVVGLLYDRLSDEME